MLHRFKKLVTDVRHSYENYEFSPVFHQIHNFCAVDLSSFYLDFAKDILYIEAADNKRRRSIQTGYYEILTALVKLLTPIIPHTADEVWEYIPETEEESVQLTDIPNPEEMPDFQEIAEKWDHFMLVRDDVLKALEEARNEKVIGKSLEAKLIIMPKDGQTKQVLESIDELHQYLIVSEVDLVQKLDDGKKYTYVDVHVDKHPGEKCERCWVASHTVGEVSEHPTLCSRCATIVKENNLV
jgi:isoleucyl-tRNA synthetase